MHLLYNAAIYGYNIVVRLAAAAGNKKAAKWVKGRKHQKISPISESEKVAWFHCASLGEFEQGRPVIESFKKQHPDFKIVLTFFSPSGYEIRKNYEQADYVYYLPADTPSNARMFIDLIQPQIAFFIKYEFWFNYLRELWRSHTPTYLISGIFRKNQHFFRWYSEWFRRQLRSFEKFFVQNEESYYLAESMLPGKSKITGDTRFDRVYEIARKAQPFTDIKKFKNGETLFLAGSTWPADEEIFLPSVLEATKNRELKVIIAPHEVHEQRIEVLMKQLPDAAIRYSHTSGDFSDKQILVIDSIGLLSHLYQYGDIAYIGGGFGVGIHNTLEAATFGLPILFGPNYQKFHEAIELIENEAAFSIHSKNEFDKTFQRLLENQDARNKAGKQAKDYVHRNKGGTKLILDNIVLRV